MGFQPNGTGEREGTVFVITNENGPVQTASFFGYGIASPNGAATVTGAATAGSPLTCTPSGFSDGTAFAYEWQKDGNTFNETGPKVTPTDADIGARYSWSRLGDELGRLANCYLGQERTHCAQGRIRRLDGSLVDESVCRAVQAPSELKVGTKTVKLSYGKPVTPSSTFVLDAPGLEMMAMIDGQALAHGTGHVASPDATLFFRVCEWHRRAAGERRVA